MYNSLRIENFRCHHDLEVRDLARVNLIAGRNNVGKTSVLEALFILCGRYNPMLAISADARRGLERIEATAEPRPWADLFVKYDLSAEVRISGTRASGASDRIVLRDVSDPETLGRIGAQYVGKQGLAADGRAQESPTTLAALELVAERNGQPLSFYAVLRRDGFAPVPAALPPPPFPGYILPARGTLALDEEAALFTRLDIADRGSLLADALRIIEPDLEDLGLLMVAGQPVIHGRLPGSRPIPLPILGDGMQRLATIVLRIANANGGVVLVDEIETGLHHTVLLDAFRAIGKAASDSDVQVFATTHSAECIEAARLAFADEPFAFRLHRIDRSEGRTCAVTYDMMTLEAASEIGLEVR